MKGLFDSATIEERIREIALSITNNKTHTNKDTPVVLICVLNGGFMFYAKLAEQLQHLDPECDFIKVKSYEGQERGGLEILLHSSINVKDKDVYIVDDIYDSGVTMDSLKKYYTNKGASNVTIVTLIKRAINEINMPYGSYYGFQIHDEWVVGFGLDDEEGKKRTLSYILAI
jgi:hypoxanthine phosphoribosyltransferase